MIFYSGLTLALFCVASILQATSTSLTDSSDDSSGDISVRRSDFGGDDDNTPISLHRIPDFKLDPSAIEVIADEDEDRPINLDVYCDRFLSAPADHIEPMFREIPLHDDDNFKELTEDPTCVPHFVNKCTLITSGQIQKVWEAKKREGLLTLHKIGCLQRIRDLAWLEDEEILSVVQDLPLGDWNNWSSIKPKTLLRLIKHQNYPTRLMPVEKAGQINDFLSSDEWLKDSGGWQLFDEPFIQIVSGDNTGSRGLADMLAFSIRFPRTFSGEEDTKELTMIPRWALRVYQFIIELALEQSKNTHIKNTIKGLLGELLLAYESLQKIQAESKLIQLAKSMILNVPPTLGYANNVEYHDRFKASKNLAIEINKLGETADIWSIIHNIEKKAVGINLYGRDELAKEFIINGLESLSAPLKAEFMRNYFQLALRPDMSEYELEKLKQVIEEDLGDVNEENDSENLEDSGYSVRKIPEIIRKWLSVSWLAGSSDAFVHVCSCLNKAWGGDSRATDDLILELAQQDPDFVECALSVVTDVRKALTLILRPENEDEDFRLRLKNIPFEEIHRMPLNEQHFWKPSFDLLVDQTSADRMAISCRWFSVDFTNERGVDGGGPRRNWIFKMLWAWMDERRFLLKSHDMYIVPGAWVHFETLYGLGRLIGKGIIHEAGLPFAFHPQFVKILQAPDDEKLKREVFLSWYKDELYGLDQKLEMGVKDFEEIADAELVSTNYWHLGDDFCGSTIGTNVADAIDRGCRVPIFNDPKTDPPIMRSFTEWLEREGSQYADSPLKLQEFGKVIHDDFKFLPTTTEDVEVYIAGAKELLQNQFNAGIQAFLSGLDMFIEVSKLKLLKTSVMMEVFSPIIKIDKDSLIKAFRYSVGELNIINDPHEVDKPVTLTARVACPDDLREGPLKEKILKARAEGNPLTVNLVEAFEYGLASLSMEGLHGFIGQLTGSRVCGLGGFQPKQFWAVFSSTPVSRPLISADDQCKAVAMNGRVLELPKTASCVKAVFLPLYATLEEFVIAVHAVSTASDEFPRA